MDTRIVKTKARLIRALSELSEGRDIGEITVSELCKKAGVNRTTFYKYYQVPADVGRESFERHLAELQREMNAERPDDLYETTLYCCRKYRENFLLTKQVFPGFKVDGEVLREFYLNLNKPEVFTDKNKLYFLASGSAGVVDRWLNETPEISPEETARSLTRLISAVLKT